MVKAVKEKVVENTSTALTVRSEEEAAFLKASGLVEQNRQYNSIPRLYIEKNAEDDDGNPLIPGAFYVHGNEDIVPSKNIKFRPLVVRNKILKYDDDFRMEATSIYFENYQDELYDTDGGIACGRLFGKAAKNVDEQTMKFYKQSVPVHKHVFGLAYFPDSAEPVAVDYRLGGGNSFIMGVALEAASRNGSSPMQFMFDLTTKREKNGTNVWYALVAEPDLTNPLPISDVMETGMAFLAHIKEENERVMSEHKKALKGKSSSEDRVLEAKIINANSIDADFEEIDNDDDVLF
jgi:hypothetical protein